MRTFDNNNYMIAWDPESGNLKVGPHPDATGWSDVYPATTGHCFASFNGTDPSEQAQLLLNLAASLMFEGIQPNVILREFAKIGVWCNMGVDLPEGEFRRAFISGDTGWKPHNPESYGYEEVVTE